MDCRINTGVAEDKTIRDNSNRSVVKIKITIRMLSNIRLIRDTDKEIITH